MTVGDLIEQVAILRGIMDIHAAAEERQAASVECSRVGSANPPDSWR